MPTAKLTSEDCVKCGACCVAQDWGNDGWAEIEPEDEARLPKRFVRQHVGTERPTTLDRFASSIFSNGNAEPTRFIKTDLRVVQRGPARGCEVNACVALKGDVMHKVRCSIYEQRPKVCRVALKPNDATCKSIRRWFNESIEQE